MHLTRVKSVLTGDSYLWQMVSIGKLYKVTLLDGAVTPHLNGAISNATQIARGSP